MPRFNVTDKLRLIEVVSNSKVCPRCMIFCMERKPYFKYGQSAIFFANKGRLPETKVFCKNGCSVRFPDWGWLDVMDPKLFGKHIPRR